MQTTQLSETPVFATTTPAVGGEATERRRWAATTGLAFLGSLGLYWRTAAPTVYGLDSAELTTAAATGGLVHATGYPFYLLVGRIWSRLPLGDVGFRMNLLSAVCGALTVALVVRLLRRLDVSPWVALGAAGLLASTRYFWAMAVMAEVYTLHTALMCGVLLLLLSWADQPTAPRLGATAALLALAAGNHASSILLAPGCVWFALAVDRRRALRPAALAAVACGVGLGLGIYLYLPYLYLKDPAFNYLAVVDGAGQRIPIDLTTWEGLLSTVSGEQFSGMFFSVSGRQLLEKTGGLVLELWRTSFAIAFGPALLGIWLALRRSRAVGGALLLIALANAAFFLTYGALDTDTMYLPVYVVWVLWTGLGAQAILAYTFERASRASAIALASVLAGAVVVSFAWTYRLVDLSDDWSARELGEAILAELEPDALFVGAWAAAPVVEYLRLVEGRRPDVEVVSRFHITRRDLAELVSSSVDRRPVYVDIDSTFGVPQLESRPAGPVFRLVRAREDPP